MTHRCNPGEPDRRLVEGLRPGVGFPAEVMQSVTTDRRLPDLKVRRSVHVLTWHASLPSTADRTHGSSNLASRPRAGNYSRDMRAGLAA